MTTQRKERKNQRDFPILVVVTGLLATTWRMVWFLCSLPYVLRHTEHTKNLQCQHGTRRIRNLTKKKLYAINSLPKRRRRNLFSEDTPCGSILVRDHLP